jgi:hypothetical protein
MSSARRFAPSRGAYNACFIVRDANGQALGYFDDEPQRRSATNRLIIKVIYRVFRNIAYGDGATAMREPRIPKQSR